MVFLKFETEKESTFIHLFPELTDFPAWEEVPYSYPLVQRLENALLRLEIIPPLGEKEEDVRTC
jgi:hypothetical protein